MAERLPVFVFGTLKSGFPNHRYLTGQEYLGSCATALPYPLYLIGPRHSPWLVDSPGSGYQVRGEVYRVDETTLQTLDELERITEPGGYFRARIRLLSDVDSSELTAYCYFKHCEALQDAEIQLGPLAEYQQAHARRYRSRSG